MEKNKDKIEKRLFIMAVVLIGALILGILLPSCSPKIIEKVRTEYVYQNKEVRDTTYVHDSIRVKEYTKGDTVYLDKYVYKYFYKDRFLADTVLKEVHDTTMVEKKVEKELTWGQKTKQGAFWWLIAALAGSLIWIFRKQIFALIKKLF